MEAQSSIKIIPTAADRRVGIVCRVSVVIRVGHFRTTLTYDDLPLAFYKYTKREKLRTMGVKDSPKWRDRGG
jgi:hypothetical protein